jgi:hypothetical protein
VVLRFLKAYVEGTRRLLTDRELGTGTKKSGGVEDRELLNTTFIFHDPLQKKSRRSIPGSGNRIGPLAENNLKARGRRAEEFMDTSFMENEKKRFHQVGVRKPAWLRLTSQMNRSLSSIRSAARLNS